MPLLSVILNEVPLGTDTCHFEWSEAKSRNPANECERIILCG